MRIFGTPPIMGTPDDDDLPGTIGDDFFDLAQGGDDTARGLAGSDQFSFGATFNAHDHVFGGSGFDTLLLSGEYDITFTANSIKGVEQIYLDNGFDYTIHMKDANVAAGKTLIVNAGDLTGASDLTFDGHAEANGKFIVYGGTFGDTINTGAGNDQVFGGAGNDFIGGGLGVDTLSGGDGDDIFFFDGAGALTGKDRVDGGLFAGTLDAVVLAGDYSAGLTIGQATLSNIQKIGVLGDFDYVVNISHMNVANTAGVIIDGSFLDPGATLHVDATGVDVQVNFRGGPGADVFIGGKNYDSFSGNGGVDTMTAGPGPSAFYYYDVTDSTGKKFDTVIGFDARADFFYPTLPSDDPFELHTTAVDHRVNGGTLSTGTFNGDLAAAIGAGELGVAHAVLFAPDHGSLAGELFLVIDANDHAGYQANADIVVHFQDAKHMSAFDITNFGNAG